MRGVNIIINVKKVLVFILFAVAICGIISTANAVNTVKYKVTWDANGGTIGTAKTTTTNVEKGKKIAKLPTTPKRNGYAFNGWYTQKIGGKKINANTIPTKNVKYFAQWTISYKITWNANGGTLGSVKTTTTNVKKGNTIAKLPTTPKLDGYFFKGWYTQKTDGTKISANTKPTKSVTYFAQWTKITAKTLVGNWEAKHFKAVTVLTYTVDGNYRKTHYNGDVLTEEQRGSYTVTGQKANQLDISIKTDYYWSIDKVGYDDYDDVPPLKTQVNLYTQNGKQYLTILPWDEFKYYKFFTS